MAKEDAATLSIHIWGVPSTPQINRYTHFAGLEGADVSVPAASELPDLPALPMPPVLSTARQVTKLTDENTALKADIAELRAGLQIIVSQLALDRGIPPGNDADHRHPEEVRVRADRLPGLTSDSPLDSLPAARQIPGPRQAAT